MDATPLHRPARLKEFSLISRAELWITILALALFFTIFIFATRDVVVEVDGLRVTGKTRMATVAGALSELGMTITEDDLVTPNLKAALQKDTVINVIKAFPVYLFVDGKEYDLKATGGTVAQVIANAGVNLGPLDKVNLDLDATIEPNMMIRVVRVTQETVKRKVRLYYHLQTIKDKNLDRGVRKVVQRGSEGVAEETVLRTYEDGVLTEEKVIGKEVIKEPVHKIVVEGTRNPLRTLDLGSRGKYYYRDVLTMVATAYEPGPTSCGIWADGYTFTGVKAGPGIVAVDPKVIPLGTKLYVEGYGYARAEDIGGAIKGNRIDVCFNTVEEALAWGRKTVKVYILEDPPR